MSTAESRRFGCALWHRVVRMAVLAYLLIPVLGTGVLYADPPEFDDVVVNTYEDTVTDIWIEDYVYYAEGDLDYSTMTVLTEASHGDIYVDTDYGVFDYTPDWGYYGFDYFSFDVEDEYAQLSAEVMVDIYVVPYNYSITNVAPLIVDFIAVELGTSSWQVSGRVIDEDPDGMTVSFGGLLTGNSCTTNANGEFSYTKTITSNGSVTAQAEDDGNLLSAVVTALVAN